MDGMGWIFPYKIRKAKKNLEKGESPQKGESPPKKRTLWSLLVLRELFPVGDDMI